MKSNMKILTVLVASMLLINCPTEKNENSNRNLLLLATIANSNGNTNSDSVPSGFSNSVVGSSVAVQGTTGTAQATSYAIGDATSGASSAAANLMASERNTTISRAIPSHLLSCDGTNKNISGIYTTETIVTVSPETSYFLLSGSYTVKPNIQFSGTYACTNITSNTGLTMKNNFKYNGSMTVVFNNAKLKYFDIEDFVKNSQFTFREVTLNGTVETYDIRIESSSESSSTYVVSSGIVNSSIKSNTKSSYFSRDKSIDLQIDGRNPIRMEITNESSGDSSLETKGTTTSTSYSSCYSNYFSFYGKKSYGTFNGEFVSASYNWDTETSKRFNEFVGFPVTMCTN